MKAGHSQWQITQRYIHAAQLLFPGAAAKGEARMFALTETPRNAWCVVASGPVGGCERGRLGDRGFSSRVRK